MPYPGRKHANLLLVAVTQAIGQAFNGYLLFKLGMLDQAQGVLVNLFQGAAGTHRLEPAQLVKSLADVLQHGKRHRPAAQPELPHGIKIGGLIFVGTGTIGQGEQAVVRLFEKAGEYGFQFLTRSVTQPDQCSRQRKPARQPVAS